MMKTVYQFIHCDENGAAAFDWIVLTGLIAGFAISLTMTMEPGLKSQGTGIVSKAEITTEF